MLTNRPLVMGVLNVTPDSFSDGGKYRFLDAALVHAEAMVAEGVDIIDVGGESTRPGAGHVGVGEELERVVPVVQAIVERFGVRVSVDTSQSKVMSEAIVSGASMINDVRALMLEGALDVVQGHDVDVCLMHMQGQPGTMQREPRYQDVVSDVIGFLRDRVDACLAAGIDRGRLIVDPGFGFGKSMDHNYQMLGNIERFKVLDLPILIGVSRKSMLGVLVDRLPVDRLSAGIAAATVAVWQGAGIVRTHDVGATVDALKVCLAAQSGKVVEWV